MKRLLVLAGGAALLVALLTDTLAMLGRHLQWPLLGSIEIVQVAVLVAACSALLVATLAGVHASVHLLLDRAPPRLKRGLQRAHSAGAVLLVASLLMGSLWLTLDLWRGHEESELLRIGYRPLRVLTLLAFAGLLGLFLRQLLRGGRR